jgi:hypothetical protein
MPFTPAHSAIVLPFIRINPRFVSATGLIVGSISPDFEYFFKMSVGDEHGHTLPGLLYFDLPVSIALALVFHLIVKKRLIENLPGYFQKRFHALYSFDFLGYIRVYYIPFAVSALIGALSHIFWDGFTHNGAFFVNALSFYDGAHIRFGGVNYPLWYALQNISTYVGLAVVAAYIVFMRSADVAVVTPSIKYWLIVCAIILIIIFIRFNFEPMKADSGNLVISLISAGCIATIIAGLLPLRNRRHG